MCNDYAIGWLCVLITANVGNAMCWLGRSAQYLAGTYLPAVVVSIIRNNRRTKVPIHLTLASHYHETTTDYRYFKNTASYS